MKESRKKKILVVCTGNSCRSQMAEGFLRESGKDRVEVFSAGIMPQGVNPVATKVMKETGVDISFHTSNHVDEYCHVDFDYVITVCDHAKENCPHFASQGIYLHQNFIDPAKFKGGEREMLKIYRDVRDQIKIFCDDFLLKAGLQK